jgi:glycosyltransferase involved in cell wall biosynthesis
MRFLIDAHHLGLRQTGNETWCRSVVARLGSELTDHELHFAVTRAGVPELRRFTDAPCHVVSTNPVRRLGIDLPYAIARLRPDAVLGQYTIVPSPAGSVVAIHDLSPLDPRACDWLSARFRLRFRASVGLSTRLASFVLAPSQFTRRQILEKLSCSPDRVRVASISIDSELAALLDSGPTVEPVVPTVLSVGNVVPRKNLITVARAVRRLQLKGMPVRYRVAGQVSPRWSSVEQQLRRTLPDIEITGYVTPQRLAQLYLSSSVLAFPSLFEGYGLPLVEAMRASLPVICSSSTSLPEIAADACMVIRPLDVHAWEAAIESVLLDPDTRQRLSDRGRTRALTFDWRETARTVAASLVAAGTLR